MQKSKIAFILFIVIQGLTSQAAPPQFTGEEKEIYQAYKQKLAETSANCLDSTYAEHEKFYNQYGISKFYGNRRKDYATRQGRLEALKKYGVSSKLIDQLEPISCIGLSMKCLQEGFEKVGLDEAWNKIYSKLSEGNRFLGTELIAALQELGWTTIYWNPDSSQNQSWDEEDRHLNPVKDGQRWNPVWGGHQYHYSTVKKKGHYYGIKVDDSESLVDFGVTPPESFKAVRFFVGIAHAGYHVFPGRLGQVIEAHSMRNLNSKENLEFSSFNPLAPKGGPRWTAKERYRSGLIVIP